MTRRKKWVNNCIKPLNCKSSVNLIYPDDVLILNESGNCIGWVLSCAKIDNKQIALAYILKDEYEIDKKIGCYQLARSQSQKNKGKKDSVDIGEKLKTDIDGTMIKRFEKF